MARKKGAAGPSILRSRVKWITVLAWADMGDESAASNAKAADRVSRLRSTMAILSSPFTINPMLPKCVELRMHKCCLKSVGCNGAHVTTGDVVQW